MLDVLKKIALDGVSTIPSRRWDVVRRLRTGSLAYLNDMARMKKISTAEEVQGTFKYQPQLVWNSEVKEYLSKAYGRANFANICTALTCPSIQSCIRVNNLRTTTEEVIHELRDYLSRHEVDDQFTPEGQPISNVINQLRERIPMPNALTESPYEHPVLKDVIIVQGKGPHAVDYDEKGIAPKVVLVGRKCAEAVLRGAHVFVPGVLACSPHIEKGDLVAVAAAVERMDNNGKWCTGITRGTILSSEHAKSQFCEIPSDCFVGKGRAMMSRTTLFRETNGIAIQMVDRVYNLHAFYGFMDGKIFLQNLPSIVAARVLDPRPGDRILDMCAAPGGKTTAIAQLMHDNGKVIALDRSHNKVLDILELAQELGLSCIEAYKLDALKSVNDGSSFDSGGTLTDGDKKVSESDGAPDLNREGSPCSNGAVVPSEPMGRYTSKAAARKQARKTRNGPGRGQNTGGRVSHIDGFSPHSFDKVLLDAPCSALGLRPRLFAGEETLDSLRRHASYQRRMFDQAVQLVRPGGTIVYSTCTINPGENEALVRYALDNYKFLSLDPQEPYVGGPGLVGGLDVFDGKTSREWLREGEQFLVQRFDPSSSLDTIGFFIAKFKVGQTCIMEN